MERIHKNISQSASEVKNDYRKRIDLLHSRISLLSGKDKLLMTMYLENGNTFYQMARLIGVNEVTVARRIHKIIDRLIDGEYIICLRNREKFTGREMDIAKAYFLMGLSIKETAAKHHSSFYRVRATLKKIQELVEIVNPSKRTNQEKQPA
jgi:predicted DNA-binding protein YlxM (UPF0122 family)